MRDHCHNHMLAWHVTAWHTCASPWILPLDPPCALHTDMAQCSLEHCSTVHDCGFFLLINPNFSPHKNQKHTRPRLTPSVLRMASTRSARRLFEASPSSVRCWSLRGASRETRTQECGWRNRCLRHQHQHTTPLPLPEPGATMSTTTIATILNAMSLHVVSGADTDTHRTRSQPQSQTEAAHNGVCVWMCFFVRPTRAMRSTLR